MTKQEPKEQPARAELTIDEIANIIQALSHPQPYADLKTAAYFITLCNKLTRMGEAIKSVKA